MQPRGTPSLVKAVRGRRFARRGRIGRGQHPVEQLVLDVLSRNVADGIAEIEKLADVVAAAVGVADQGQGQRTAQRLGDGAARLAAQPPGEFAPPAWRRVELDAGQVVRRRSGVDGPQFQRGGTLQEALPGGDRHLETPGQDHDADDGLLAQRPQGDRPQVLRDLIEPVQERRDPARLHQLGSFCLTAPASEQRIGLLQPGRQPVPDPLGAGIPPVQGEHHRYGHQLPVLRGHLLPVLERGQDKEHGGASLARPRLADDHQPTGSEAAVDGVQVLQPSAAELSPEGRRQSRQRREPPRLDCRRHGSGERPGGPLPVHRDRFWLQQPPLQRSASPLLRDHPGERVSHFIERPAPARIARLPDPRQVDDQADGRHDDRGGERPERGKVNTLR